MNKVQLGAIIRSWPVVEADFKIMCIKYLEEIKYEVNKRINDMDENVNIPEEDSDRLIESRRLHALHFEIVRELDKRNNTYE